MSVKKYSSDQIEKVAGFSVKQKDVIDLGLFDEAMHEWTVNNGYASRDDQAFPETLMLQRVSGDGAREIWFKWRLEKVPPDTGNKSDPRFIYQMRINVHTLAVKKTEVVRDGQKLKLDKGEVEVIVTANLITDPNKTWEKSSLPDFVKKWLWKRAMLGEIDKHRKSFMREAYNFGDMIKRHFYLHTLTPEPQGEFFPAKGIQE